jgi:class 3 adenylate cyclase/tetratricopeptide (TPR) repeat protein
VNCGACGAENRAGRKFCSECGASLAVTCAACGASNDAGDRFCGECGSPLVGSAAAKLPPERAAERRLVSVLFLDLVGFTSASEGRDAEDTRELLTRYFDLARTTVERYGGVVEKFIGDAVMALWGAPVAQEDDAERAVRAALELVAAVPSLDPALGARAGVLSGEAAVTLGAEGQGMVAGDLVNTASRIQSAAEPGQVLVGEATKRASEAAIAYEDAGGRDLKGKSEPLPLWRALRVVAARGGEGRSAGLEAPFVGRDRELRLVKDLFHATADEGRAHLLSIVGVAGIGKSRLAWEFEKYVDGLVGEAWWHKGRCLAYGDGVAYWALAEMIRWRARIAEDEDPEEARRKLAETVAELVSDEEERAFVEPRLQHLLGLAERVASDREDLFSAWRLFLERMADQLPVIMVFEDIQWADDALLEFLEYLLDWSRGHPLHIVTLARPEIAERHPGWGANLRNFTSLALEPLGDDSIDELLRGLVPGLPDDAIARIRERADGIPLYAMETVRMLLDRGLLEAAEGEYRLTGDLGALDVPETLHGLIAARLDGLDADERRLLQDAAVLGKTFAPRGLAVLGGLDEEAVRPALTALVRKELLALDTDPRSPERGQYGFLQALVQRVAYETLSRRDRKAKHLAAAAYLTAESGIDPDEIAEVIAAHLLDAYRVAPDDTDAAEIKGQAREWLRRAGERAAALAATDDAQRAFEAAAELADDPLERARLLERAGDRARGANRLDVSERLLREAAALTREAGATHDHARVSSELALTLWRVGKIEGAIELAEEAYAVLAADERDHDVATLAAGLGRLHHFAGHPEEAAQWVETALDIGEDLQLPDVVSSALNTKSLVVRNHRHESEALLRHALQVALDNDLTTDALRAYNNLFVLLSSWDREEEAFALTPEALALARRRGDRFWESQILSGVIEEGLTRGDWDEALQASTDLHEHDLHSDSDLGVVLARMRLERGERDEARGILDQVVTDTATTDLQLRTVALWGRRLTAELEGRYADAIAAANDCLIDSPDLMPSQWIAEAIRDVATYATLSGDHAAALAIDARVDELSVAVLSRSVEAQRHRLRANAAAAAGDDDGAATAFGIALANARSLGFAFWLAPVLFDYGAWLVSTGRGDEAAPLLAEARELFERMGAAVWLRRLDAIAPAGSGQAAAAAGAAST